MYGGLGLLLFWLHVGSVSALVPTSWEQGGLTASH